MLTQTQRRYQAEKKAAKYVARFRALATRCDVCGGQEDLECHEIPRAAPDRLKARGKPFACLLVCGGFSRRQCHARMGGTPRARQLAYLYLSRPGHLRMEFYNRLFRPMVALEDVMLEVKRLTEGS